jgi:DNA-3-methyladenine glycosylase
MNGPGKLAMAMQIGKELDGEPLTGKRLYITDRDQEIADDDIAISPRIGIDGAGEAAHWPLRFFFAGNRYVSVHRQWR